MYETWPLEGGTGVGGGVDKLTSYQELTSLNAYSV